jgi:UDP-glucose 4-epimerase
VTKVVHTAGLIGGKVQQSLSLAFDINLNGTRNVAEAVRLTGVQRLVHMSTFGVYDMRRKIEGPVTEDHPRGAGRGYGNYKGAKELILEAFAAQYGFELIMLRPANVYGYGHFFGGSSGGAKMQALLEAGALGNKASIPAAETMTNEYIYADDMGRAVDLALNIAMPPVTVFNIGNGYVTPFDELVKIVQEVAPGLDYEILPGDPPKSKNFPLDISRARQHLGWEPRFTLKAGFEDYLTEMRKARS